MLRLLVTIPALLTIASAAEVVVSPDGPTRTLEEARDRAREIHRGRPSELVTVRIPAGVYELANTLVLGAADSNTSYEAEPGSHTVISGGRAIGNWTKSTRREWKASVPDGKFRQLFLDGRRAQRARTPNAGYLRTEGKPVPTPKIQLRYRGQDVKPEWVNGPAEAFVLMNWFYIRMPIVALDESTRMLTLASPGTENANETDARYWIENTRDALDAPGEWFLDSGAGEVLYIPLQGEELPTAHVVAPRLLRLVELEGNPEAGDFVRNVRFRNLTFAYSDWSMPPEGVFDMQAAIETGAAIEATAAVECSIEHCRFEHLGEYAILLGKGSKRNRIVANEFADIGAGGVRIGETRMRENEAERNSGNVVSDNEMHGLGRVHPSAVGVWIGQSTGDEVSHNHIHDLFYTAISAGWTWGYGPNQSRGHRIEFNHLHDIGKGELSDMGAIYTLGVQPGTVLGNNLIHDVSSFTYGGWGIYPDEGSSEIVIENNVVYGCKSAGFHQHYGRENVVRNNIFAWNHEAQLMRSRVEKHVSFTFERNIVLFDDGRLLGANWSGEGIRMDGNLYWDMRGGVPRFSTWSWDEWRKRGLDEHSKIADPLFRNASNADFRLLPESPALAMGFRPIDLTTVGPRVKPGIEAR